MFVDLDFNYVETTAAMDKFSQKDIEELRNWTIKIDKTKSVPKNLSDKQLVLFYNACYGDMDKTKISIENYYECRKNAPELFNYRVWNEDLRKASEAIELFLIPGKSAEGYQVIYCRFYDSEPSHFEMEFASKLFFMIIEYSLYKLGPQSGYVILFDMDGLKMGHLTRLNISVVRTLFQYLQEAAPIRIRAIHVLNTEPILDKLVSIIRPFTTQELFDISKFHKKDEDMEKVYEIFPRNSLPSNYGGSLPDRQTLHKRYMEEVKLAVPYFKIEEEQRLAALSKDSALEGTFKKLEID